MDFGLGMYIQHIGDKNDIKVSNAGIYKFFDIIFRFKHPIYREVEYCKFRNKALNPQPIKEILESKSGWNKLW